MLLCSVGAPMKNRALRSRTSNHTGAARPLVLVSALRLATLLLEGLALQQVTLKLPQLPTHRGSTVSILQIVMMALGGYFTLIEVLGRLGSQLWDPRNRLSRRQDSSVRMWLGSQGALTTLSCPALYKGPKGHRSRNHGFCDAPCYCSGVGSLWSRWSLGLWHV